LDHIGQHAGFTKCGDGLMGVIANGGDEFVVGFAFPGFGYALMTGIGPSVGVVEVEQDFVAEFFGVFGYGDGVFEAVGQLGRAVEQTQADPVKP
jgi:hypothetical protein